MAERETLLVQVRSSTISVAYVTSRELAHSCGVGLDLVTRLIALGLLDPVGRGREEEPLFEAVAVPLLRKILRLRHDLGINYEGIGVVLQLMERIEQMEERIRELETLLFP
ncbi:MAG TPA: MerR family transcriptional regulator [Syntrophobacteraceae bacterium]|nr:MerR family transcriptional regulator [Syntrophobacteraceae bacterium]